MNFWFVICNMIRIPLFRTILQKWTCNPIYSWLCVCICGWVCTSIIQSDWFNLTVERWTTFRRSWATLSFKRATHFVFLTGWFVFWNAPISPFDKMQFRRHLVAEFCTPLSKANVNSWQYRLLKDVKVVFCIWFIRRGSSVQLWRSALESLSDLTPAQVMYNMTT